MSSYRCRAVLPEESISSSHIYIYIYICCEVIIWSKFGVFKCYYLVQVGVFKCYYLVQVCFLAYKNSGLKRFGLHTQLSFCVLFFVPNYLAIF